MKTEPMKPITEMLDEIQGRADAAKGGPWVAFQAPGDKPHWRINGIAKKWPFKGEQYTAWIPAANERDKEAETVAVFIAAARADVPKLVEALRCALTTLQRNATPALGGKAQQSDAQAALIELQSILSKP